MKRRILAIILLVAILFTSFASVSFAGTKKETGLYKVDGKWKYYENGKFTKATGLVMKPDKKTWHYVENGVYKKVTGLVQCVQPGSSKGKWYYVYKGDLNKKATGLVKCVQPGKSKGKWYYVENGKQKKVTGLVKCIQPKSKSKGKWYYVKKGKKASKTGVVSCVQPGSSKGKKYYVEKGVKQYSVTSKKDEKIYLNVATKLNKKYETMTQEAGFHCSVAFALFDCTGDGVKELVCFGYRGSMLAFDLYVYTIKNGRPVKIYDGSVTGGPKAYKGTLYVVWSRVDFAGERLINWNGKKLVDGEATYADTIEELPIYSKGKHKNLKWCDLSELLDIL